MVSALAAPEDVDALPVPAPCAVASDDADAASTNSKDKAALLSLMNLSFVKNEIRRLLRCAAIQDVQ
jgi:hypothetical protein